MCNGDCWPEEEATEDSPTCAHLHAAWLRLRGDGGSASLDKPSLVAAWPCKLPRRPPSVFPCFPLPNLAPDQRRMSVRAQRLPSLVASGPLGPINNGSRVPQQRNSVLCSQTTSSKRCLLPANQTCATSTQYVASSALNATDQYSFRAIVSLALSPARIHQPRTRVRPRFAIGGNLGQPPDKHKPNHLIALPLAANVLRSFSSRGGLALLRSIDSAPLNMDSLGPFASSTKTILRLVTSLW